MTKIQDILNGKISKKPPVWFMRQAGRYLPEYKKIRSTHPDFMSFCQHTDDIVEVTLQPIRRFNFDAAIIFSDILTIPHFLGQKVTFKKGEGPLLETVSWEKFIKNSENKDLSREFLPIKKAISEVRQKLDKTKSLYGFVGSPWTVLTYMIRGSKKKSFQDVLDFKKGFPSIFNALLNILVEKSVEILSYQIDSGADVVQIFDSWASAVPNNLIDSVILDPLFAIRTQLYKKYPHIPVVYFGKGVSHLYKDIEQSDYSFAFGVDQHADLQKVASNLSSPLQGNLDPEKLVEGNIEGDVKRILEAAESHPLIFNLGHGILPHTPIQHVEKTLKLIRE